MRQHANLLLSGSLLSACAVGPDAPADRALPVRVAGALHAGVAEGDLDAPVGAPLGGYTGRCTCFGGEGEVDGRDTAYTLRFNPSVGVQTRPTAKVVWLDNGDQDLVLMKTDAIFAFEGIHREVAARLEAETGRDLEGRVVLATSHSHAAPGGWDRGLQWFLGFDRFNRELYERHVEALTQTALAAYADLEPAALGVGLETDWDPEDRVYSDRRGENDTLAFFDDIPAGTYKDPYLSLVRIDRISDDSPMAVLFGFAMHGTVLGGDNQLFSSEAGGHVELAVEEHFADDVLVAWLQHGGGDAGPGGTDRDFARMETIGAQAVGAVLDLWEATPSSADALVIETVTHGIDSSRDAIAVDRPHGELVYSPYAPGQAPDQETFDAEGRVLTPIDEFNTDAGAAFCGDPDPLFPNSGVGGTGPAYASCADVGVLGPIIGGMFDMTAEEFELPLPESTTITATTSLLSPVSIRQPSGEVVQDDLLLAFLPGEATAMLTEQLRRRAADELGLQTTLPIAYAQDHMGYMLIPEDWLQGGYEANINLWGPLQAEHVVEEMLWMAEHWLLTEEVEAMRPRGILADADYQTKDDWPTLQPDETPDAGTLLDAVPEGLVVLGDLDPAVAPPDALSRVSGVAQLAWEGGDPGVDLPTVTLQRLDGADWVDVTTASGRVVSDRRADIILTTTPDPIEPIDAPQAHRWWAAWQAVGTDDARMGLPLGTYRLEVRGERYVGGATQWPWPAEGYRIEGPAFEVRPADIELALDDDGISAWIDGPSQGFRMVDPDGRSRGANPVRQATLTWTTPDGAQTEERPADAVADGVGRFLLTPPAGATALTLTDAWGNTGVLPLSP